MRLSQKLVVIGALTFISGRALSAILPTGITFAFGGPGTSATRSYELEGDCPLYLLSYSVHMVVEAAVPIYRPRAPGDTRLLLLGRKGKERQLWVGCDSGPCINKRLPFDDVASISPFSNNDVIVAQANGTISIIDHEGEVLKKVSIQDRLSGDIENRMLGNVIRVWRTGSQSLCAVTENYIVHWNYSNSATATAIPHQSGKVFTANGDKTRVCLVHEAVSPTTFSFSLFSLSTNGLLATHAFDTGTKLEDSNFPPIYPIYHDTEDGRSYFAFRKKLIAVTEDSIEPDFDWRLPELKNLINTATSDYLVFSPPVQGRPFSADHQQLGWGPPNQFAFDLRWMTSLYGPQGSSSNADNSERENAPESWQTKTELTDYLRVHLTENSPAVDRTVVKSQCVARRFNDEVKPMPDALKQAIRKLGPAILGNHGLRYFERKLILHTPTATASLSDWVDSIWEQRLRT